MNKLKSFSVFTLVLFVIVQIILIYKFPFYRHDEVQLFTLIDIYSFKAHLFPGATHYCTGGQAFTFFIMKLLTQAFSSPIKYKIAPFLVSLIGLILFKRYLDKTKTKYAGYILFLIAIHPSFLFFSTDFKHYIFDFFFISIALNLTIDLDKKVNRILLVLFSFGVIFLSLPATLVLLSFLGVNFLFTLKNKKYIKGIKLFISNIVFIFLSMGGYLYLLKKNHPFFFPFMKEYWAKYPNTLVIEASGLIEYITLFFQKLMTIIYSYSFISSYLILNLFVLGFVQTFKKDIKFGLSLFVLFSGVIISSLLEQFPIPAIGDGVTEFYIHSRTTFFLLPFSIIIFFNAFELILIKVKKNKSLYAFIFCILLITPNFLAVSSHLYKDIRKQEHQNISNILTKYQPKFLFVSGLTNFFEFFLKSNQIKAEIKDLYNFKSDYSHFKTNDPLFLLFINDKFVNKFNNDKRFYEVEQNYYYKIFKLK